MPAKGFKKQFCINGHDISLLGRENNGKGACIACRREKAKQVRENNRDEINAQRRKWQHENRESINAKRREWRRINIEHCRQIDHEWFIANREKILKQRSEWKKKDYIKNKEKINKQQKESFKRRKFSLKSKFLSANGNAKAYNRSFPIILDQYAFIISSGCAYCGIDLYTETGGSLDRIDSNFDYTLENILPCCKVCNFIKNDLHTVEETKVMIRTRDIIRTYPQLIDIFLSKDPGFIPSPFIPEKARITKENRSLRSRYNNLVRLQRKKDKKVPLSFTDYEKINEKPCFYCGIKIVTSNGIELDKKDPNGLYELDNVLHCCFTCNTIKNNFHTVTETKIMVIARNLFRKKFLSEEK